MTRQVRDQILESREARKRLTVRAEPHWRALDSGLHLGYRRRADGGSWIARRFTIAGKYVKQKLGVADDFQDADEIKTLSYRQAIKLARDWSETQIRKEAGLNDIHHGPYKVSDCMIEYMNHYSVEGRGVSATQSSINAHITPHLGKLDAGKLTTKKISDWHHNMASSHAMLRTGKTASGRNIRQHDIKDPEAIRRRRSTANRVLTILKAALNYAWKEGKIASDNPWRRVKPFRNVAAPVIRYLTAEECTRLINASESDFRLLLQGALLTGCRYGELAALKAKDFNSDSGTVLVRMSKSGKVRHVVLTDEGQKFFQNVVSNKEGSDLVFSRNGTFSWTASHQKRPLLEACKHARIKPAISFHILRHTHGSLLAMKGVPMAVIAQQLGHADTRMTEKHYAHLSPSYVAETIRNHFPRLGISVASNVTRLDRK